MLVHKYNTIITSMKLDCANPYLSFSNCPHGEGNDTPLQYSCLENPMDRGACNPWGHEESDTTEWLPFHVSFSCLGEGNGNPLQCSCLENPRDSPGAWWAAVYGDTALHVVVMAFQSSIIQSIFPMFSFVCYGTDIFL